MIPRTLRNTDQPILRYVWKAALLALIPSMVVSFLVGLVASGIPPTFKGPKPIIIFNVLFVAPWVETLIMWLILWILKRFIKRTISLAAASALIWGVLHSTKLLPWGFVVFWPFFVFSFCFLQWEKKSKLKAIIATGLTHTCQNILPAIALLFVST